MKLNFKIHRGADEIGGSCIEVWTENTRIIFDFGMPLYEETGERFNLKNYQGLKFQELLDKKILPDINGLYDNSAPTIDGIVISHSHFDHYGLANFINKNIKVYLGRATHKIIEINNIFLSNEVRLENIFYFHNGKSFKIGDISITPYLVDHSAFDSYAFLIKANGKNIFYSGDFRNHGRKGTLFYSLLRKLPKNIDYLLLEGSNIGRENNHYIKSEEELEEKLSQIFQEKEKINLVYTSAQNIDRLTSIYRASRKAKKILVVDVYTAFILQQLSEFARIPNVKKFYGIKVIYPYYVCEKLRKTGNEKIMYQFKKYKISKDEISRNYKKIVMIIRNSMLIDLRRIKGIDSGNFIYSLWEGYLEDKTTREFVDYFIKKRNFKFFNIHTSGHADIETLKKFVSALNPKNIVPIHTENKNKYEELFNKNVIDLKNGDIVEV